LENWDRIIKVLGSRVPAILGSISAIALGSGLLIDDYKDFGKLGDERNPPVPHHYIWGLVSLIAGVTGAGLTALDILRELGFKPPPELFRKIKERPSTLEGLPPEVLEVLR